MKPHENHWETLVSRQETPWKPLGNPWKPLENHGFQTGNPVETTWKPKETTGKPWFPDRFPDRKPRGDHWKPVATTRKPWFPDRKLHRTRCCQTGNSVEKYRWKPGVARQEIRGNLMEVTGFYSRKRYVNYLPTMTVESIVPKTAWECWSSRKQSWLFCPLLCSI